jgi:hypothetical protein
MCYDTALTEVLLAPKFQLLLLIAKLFEQLVKPQDVKRLLLHDHILS